MATSDARKSPWYHDLSAKEMEEALALVPALLEVAKAADRNRYDHQGWPTAMEDVIADLDAAHPGWRTSLTVEHRATR